jgi:hypothetical protein
MAYRILEDGVYIVRWCDRHGRKCSEVYPEVCFQAATRYARAEEAYRKRYNMGVLEYYAWCTKTGKLASADGTKEYAEKFAGPVPKEEDFL